MNFKPILFSKIKNEVRQVRSALWFRPAIFSGLAVALVFLVAGLDRLIEVSPGWVVERDPVNDILRFVAGGMLTVTTVTLSVLMLVLSLAAGQASPRTVPEIMADRVTQNALSTFLGTLVFALSAQVLLEVSAIEGLGITVLFVLALVLVATAIRYLVQWIHHVANTLKLNRIVDGIYWQAKEVLDDYLVEKEGNKDPESPGPRPDGKVCQIMAESVGYVQLIDIEELDLCAANQNLSIDLTVREGDFIHPAMSIMTVHSEEALDEANREKLKSFVVAGAERSARGDQLLGVELLAEVGCRALSPSVNDPQSAIICVNYLRALLVEAGRVGPKRYLSRKSESGRIALVPVVFSDLLKRATRPLVREGAACAEVMAALLDTLTELAQLADRDYLEEILGEAEQALLYGNERLFLQRDRDVLSSQIRSLEAVVKERRAT